MIRESQIGNTIRDFRAKQKLTLKELSRKTGLSTGYLSKVENAKKSPPVSTLLSIAKALEVNISEIFGEMPQSGKISLVKKDHRPVKPQTGSSFGYAYHSLAHPVVNLNMAPYLLTLPLKPEKSIISQHEGEELLYVLEGTMKLFYGEEEFIVEEGDCVFFDSSIPHYGICQGNKEVKCLMVISMP